MKFVERFVNIMGYLRVFIAPYGIGMIITVIAFWGTQSLTVLVLGTTLSTAAGVLFAEHVRRNYGSVNFMSALIGTPEISSGGPEVIKHILHPKHTGNDILFQTNKALYGFAVGGLYRVIQYKEYNYEQREINLNSNVIEKVYSDGLSIMLLLSGGNVILHQCNQTDEGNYVRAISHHTLAHFRSDIIESLEEIKLYTV